MVHADMQLLRESAPEITSTPGMIDANAAVAFGQNVKYPDPRD
jgi:hypothetical protein